MTFTCQPEVEAMLHVRNFDRMGKWQDCEHWQAVYSLDSCIQQGVGPDGKRTARKQGSYLDS